MASLLKPSRAHLWLCLALITVGQVLSSVLIAQFLYLGIASNQILIVLGLPILIAWYGKSNLGELFPLSIPPLKFWIWTLVLTLCLDTALEYFVWFSEKFLPLPEDVALRFDDLLSISSAEDFFLKIFFLCLLPALAEESCFRGFFQGGLSKHYGPRAALFITALIFAFLHGNPWYFHIYFLLGLWFGGLRMLSASLLPGMLSHFLNNTWTLSLHAVQLEVPFFDGQPSLDFTLFAGALCGSMLALRKLWLFSKDLPRIN